MTTIARIFVLPILAAGIFGGAVLGMSGMAHAQSLGGQEATGPGYSYSPQTHAHPAPSAKPGWHNNHGPAYIAHITGQDLA
jgi:hypothetical protein